MPMDNLQDVTALSRVLDTKKIFPVSMLWGIPRVIMYGYIKETDTLVKQHV